MSDEITRQNHYVPVWYQRGFLAHEATELHVLDLRPDVNVLADGRTWTPNARRRLPPVGAFAACDLYTTFFGTHVNDEIERRLFGGIDDRGSRAVRAYIEGDARAMHDRFQDLFEYMDAQKLRTPKGLEWIRTRYPTLDQANLMLEMQGLRLMHCRMWMEGVREIVSAENSDIKFIVSDHPVTTYNAAFPPASSACSYPSDPLIELMGSPSGTCYSLVMSFSYSAARRTSVITTAALATRMRSVGRHARMSTSPNPDETRIPRRRNRAAAAAIGRSGNAAHLWPQKTDLHGPCWAFENATSRS
ncbi:hypothetical protein [Dokdonella soli]|uniref:DUF4238 domain-containing protein n=1 Tax=Dokdonella soli TaxID=529810 RepID=A0ABP3THE1_9GAMM